MRSSFAEFVARKIAETVVCGVFVGFAERRIVEDLFDKFVYGQAIVEDRYANVDELGSGFTDEADAQKFPISAGKDEFEHACGITSNVPAGVVFIESAAYAVVNSLLFAGLFGLASGGNLRDGVNAHRQERGDTLFVFQAKSVAGSDATLLHGRGGQCGKADDIARRVNVRDAGAIVFVDSNIALVVDGQPGPFESEAIDRGATPGCEKDGFGFEFLAALHGKTRNGGKVLDLDGAFVEPEMHAHNEKTIAKAIGNFGIEKRKKPISTIDERDIHTKGREDGSIFAADDTTANDGQAFGNAIHVKKGIGIEGVYVVESDFRWAIWLGTGGN